MIGQGLTAINCSQLTKHLLQLSFNIFDKRNITDKHLNRTGLHQNVYGCNQAKNVLGMIKKVWESKGC